ncbi:hypothetical protein T492DRAFT_260640 [Pavlovales sp. CCMP2436]|nr:hypothetical protein T492DRAFT_260640 [Pavlovales sp. CCMP2436]
MFLGGDAGHPLRGELMGALLAPASYAGTSPRPAGAEWRAPGAPGGVPGARQPPGFAPPFSPFAPGVAHAGAYAQQPSAYAYWPPTPQQAAPGAWGVPPQSWAYPPCNYYLQQPPSSPAFAPGFGYAHQPPAPLANTSWHSLSSDAHGPSGRHGRSAAARVHGAGYGYGLALGEGHVPLTREGESDGEEEEEEDDEDDEDDEEFEEEANGSGALQPRQLDSRSSTAGGAFQSAFSPSNSPVSRASARDRDLSEPEREPRGELKIEVKQEKATPPAAPAARPLAPRGPSEAPDAPSAGRALEQARSRSLALLDQLSLPATKRAPPRGASRTLPDSPAGSRTLPDVGPFLERVEVEVRAKHGLIAARGSVGAGPVEALPQASAPAVVVVGSRVRVSAAGEHCGKQGIVVALDGPDVLMRFAGEAGGDIDVLPRGDVMLTPA